MGFYVMTVIWRIMRRKLTQPLGASFDPERAYQALLTVLRDTEEWDCLACKVCGGPWARGRLLLCSTCEEQAC